MLHRHLVLRALLIALWISPAAAQEILPVSNYCTFDGKPITDDVYVFSASEEVRGAVDKVLRVVGFAPDVDVRSANVETIAAVRVEDRRVILYNTYFAERLSEDGWEAWTHLAHAVAHHVEGHDLSFDRDRAIQEVEADHLAASILYRLGIPLPELQSVADSLDASPDLFPAPALRRAAFTEGWTTTSERTDQRLSFGDDVMTAGAEPQAGSGGEYPSFWPPPQASVQTVVPLSTLSPGATLGDAAREIEAALDGAGYYDRAYYAVPNGFALVARIEQIMEDGTPKDPPDRWSADVKPMRRFSLTAYFRALFTATPGHFRVVAFVVTSRPFTQQEATVGRTEAQAWLDGGLNVLPQPISSTPVAEGHACTALVYTFEQPTADDPVRFVDPSPISARMHLERAGLWKAF